MAQYFKHKDVTASVGDTVRVHQSIKEGSKSRVQVFEGIIIAIKGAGMGQSFTVRKIATGSIGVERILPTHLPSIEKIEVKRAGKVRRAKLFYLRDRIGKAATRLKEDKSAKSSQNS